MDILCIAARLYYFALLGRVILSWFPVRGEGGMATVHNALYSVTEPVLGPVRRVMPAMGGFDLSPIVVFFGISFLLRALGCGPGL